MNILETTAAPLYHGNHRALLEDMRLWEKEQFTICFPDTLKKDIEQIWGKNRKKEAVVPATFLPATLLEGHAEGFIWPEQKMVYLTEMGVRGQPQKELPIKKRMVELHFIDELKPGDYVVHIDHGIGQFRGSAVNTVDGIEKEYFLLEYAEGDKLSVPVELAYKMDKYIGSVTPKIHRLSNTTWKQLTRRIKEEAKKIASELLKLYAQRELVTIKPFGKITSVEKELADSFPYDETPDQQKAIQEVIENMEGDEPMDRLICGDVGFGKTEVAIRAAMKAVENKTQVAVLAPTTILAQQHFDTFSNRLKKFNVEIDSLSRFKTKSEQKESVAKIKTGELDIIIGTHRLLSPDIEFKNLGLIIIDEEQRFGVRHKETLKKMRVSAHVLTLTATPIPRTLNLSLSLMRDMSVIRTPPTGRQPIETIITPHDDTLIKSSVEKELARG
ncbi:MAG: CarD family transcriptional regulator, partial [Candidatus Gracilibacteria bacterium]|nr:CarD family transcriptional regulator [Candidatus Gracilibacteria bacterium]